MVHIVIPIPEKVSLNAAYAGMHWTKRNALKDLYAMSLIQFRGKFKGVEYPLDASYIFRFKGKQLDVSNCALMIKLLEDSLKFNGIIADDDPKHIQSIDVIVQEGDKDEVEIILV
jgi:hypothetical protein